MAKADKSTVVRRNQEILRLILAGGEFEDIRQYAAAQGWRLSERQLRRYQETAHQQLAESIHRDKRQLLGRHLMQRRALYARALKTSDVRTALQVLRDEAILEGLYPGAKGDETREPRLGRAPSPIGREERFLRTLAAEEKSDKKELELMKYLTPYYFYRLSDLMMPQTLLQIIALQHAAVLLDHAGMFLMSLWRMAAEDDEDGMWDVVGGCHAYRFKVESDAWDEFTGQLGVDGRQLVLDNHRGSLLEIFFDKVYESVPEHDALVARLAKDGDTPNFPTVDGLVRDWWRLLRQTLEE